MTPSKPREQLMAIANKNEDHLANYTGNIELVEALIDIIELQQAALKVVVGFHHYRPKDSNEILNDVTDLAWSTLDKMDAKLKALGCE